MTRSISTGRRRPFSPANSANRAGRRRPRGGAAMGSAGAGGLPRRWRRHAPARVAATTPSLRRDRPPRDRAPFARPRRSPARGGRRCRCAARRPAAGRPRPTRGRRRGRSARPRRRAPRWSAGRRSSCTPARARAASRARRASGCAHGRDAQRARRRPAEQVGIAEVVCTSAGRTSVRWRRTRRKAASPRCRGIPTQLGSIPLARRRSQTWLDPTSFRQPTLRSAPSILANR